MEKYIDRILIILFGWITIPLCLVLWCLIVPSFWVLKFGYVNTPYWHNVKAGYLMVKESVIEGWEII